MRTGSGWIGLVAMAAVVAGGVIGAWAQTGPAAPAAGGGDLGLPWNGALGGGGVGLAGIMFYFYRQDRKAAEESMLRMGNEFRGIVEANTRAITTLTTVIERSDGDSQ